MPIDFTISAIGTPSIGAPATHLARVPSYQPAPAATDGPKVAGPPPPSPTLRFDAAAGTLVIEFHNDAGQVTNSIPTQRQLQAYRVGAEFPAPTAAPPTNAAASGSAGAATAPDIVA